MNSKYVARHLESSGLIAKPSNSCIWKSIVDLRPNFDALAYWEVSNGANVNFWREAWVAPRLYLKDHVRKPINHHLHLQLASDFQNTKGNWNWPLLRTLFSQPVLDRINTIPPPSLTATIPNLCL